MNSKIGMLLIFISGVASGSAGMFIYMKQKWQKDFETKRDEMIRYYENKKPDAKPKVKKESEKVSEISETAVEESKNIIQKFNYAKIPDSSERTKNIAPVLNDDEYSINPYDIDPRDFGTQEMYGMVTLYLYEDGEVRTDKYELLDEEDIENYLGTMLEKLADLRDSDPDMDSFYIRNDRLKTDYEILIEAGRYEEMSE